MRVKGTTTSFAVTSVEDDGDGIHTARYTANNAGTYEILVIDNVKGTTGVAGTISSRQVTITTMGRPRRKKE